MKKILILGGTKFIGRNFIEKLQYQDNVDITIFNRQISNPDLFPEIKKIKGDRERSETEELSNQEWDYIIDFSCFFPKTLNKLIEKLKDKVGRYIFISSQAVYKHGINREISVYEGMETLPCMQNEINDTSMVTYGKRKAECERILQKATWLDKIILRPSIVYGKYDSSERFYYWLYRINHEHKFILPNNGNNYITLTYTGDLINILLKSIEISRHSTFYNVNTHQAFPLKNFVISIAKAIYKEAKYVNIDTQKLMNFNIRLGIDIPLWFNTSIIISNEKLIKDFNINLISFEQSVKEIYNYYSNLNWTIPKAGLDLKREKEIIEKLKKH